MRERRFLLTAVAVLAVASLVNANITQITCQNDGDGAIVVNGGQQICIDNPTPDGDGVYNLPVSGNQYRGNANMGGEITTDGSGDPTVHLLQDITNDTGFAWTGYQFVVGMSNPSFTLLSLSAVDMPSGWTATIIPVAPGTIPNDGSGYVGEVDFSMGIGGSPIDIGSDAIFGVKFSFTGSTSYATAQTPTPEPATLALLGLGGMALLRKRSK